MLRPTRLSLDEEISIAVLASIESRTWDDKVYLDPKIFISGLNKHIFVLMRGEKQVGGRYINTAAYTGPITKYKKFKFVTVTKHLISEV
jgi:hypothetical protein